MHKSIFLKTTESCQLNCSHCFTTGNKPARTFLDVEKTLDWVSRFSNHYSADTMHFELHGGEPFLAPLEMLEKIVHGIRRIAPQKASIGATSNLVFAMDDSLLEFIVGKLDTFGTSWDSGIRFSKPKQEALWRANLKRIIDAGKQVTLNISVSKSIIQMDQKKLLEFIRQTGCQRVQFERITSNGNAVSQEGLFPSNAEINQWYLDLHEASEQLGARSWFNNNALESVYDKFERDITGSGTFCRNCEQTIFTVNADGTIGGCPNAAQQEHYARIEDPIMQAISCSGRVNLIVMEKTQNTTCFECPVYSYCGGDCYRLAWQGDQCAAPKDLMRKLARLDNLNRNDRKKVNIPIVRI